MEPFLPLVEYGNESYKQVYPDKAKLFIFITLYYQELFKINP